MPSVKQTTVDPAATTTGMGSSSTELMVELYPGSPIHDGSMTRESVQAQGDAELLSGVVTNGMGLPSFSLDFTGQDSGVAPPDQEVTTGAGGLPASPWVPNPSSPGEGQNPSTLPAAPDGFGMEPNGDTYGVGEGAIANPKDTSLVISGGKIGSYGMGTSKPE